MRFRRQGPARGRGPLRCVVSWCFLRRSWRSCEALGREEREIEGGLTVQEPLGDVTAGGGRVLEAVTAETDGEEEARDARRPADDRVVVGRERPEARPAAGDPRALDDRQALDRLRHQLFDLAPVHRNVQVVADVLDITGAQEHLLYLFPEIEAARRSEEHTSELQSLAYLVCRLL